MSTQSKNPFDSISLTPNEEKNSYEQSTEKNPFLLIDSQDDGFLKSAFRTLYQIPSGIAQAITYPADILQMISTGASLDQEEIDSLKRQAKIYDIQFDEEKYKSSALQIAENFPTQGNIERIVEEKTGAPLTPRTKLQKGVKLGSTAGGFAPGSLSQKAVAAGTAPAVSTGLQAAGVPEGISELAGLAVSPFAATISPKISIGAQTKPSGLPTRRYESLTKPTEVSPSRAKIINEKVEGDFKNISQELIKDSPIEKTYTALKEDSQFKNMIGEKFREVEELAKEVPGKFSSKEVKKDIALAYQKKEAKGISSSEYDVDYNKFMKNFLKETPDKDLTAVNLVDQYRKNNRSLSELYEPGKSRAYNRAKKDSLLDYNKIIAESIEKKYPDSEFSELFKFSNKRWTEIKDAEFLDKYVDDLFAGKVNFEKGKKFYDKNVQESFKRAFGEENFPKFEQLIKDLLSTEQANKLIKVAEKKGFDDLVKNGIKYVIHPHLLTANYGLNTAKGIYKSLLDKPKLAVTWESGLNSWKKGDLQQASKAFNILDQELNPKFIEARKSAIKKFNYPKNN